ERGNLANYAVAAGRAAGTRADRGAVERHTLGNRNITAHLDVGGRVWPLVGDRKSYRDLTARAHFSQRGYDWRHASDAQIGPGPQFDNERVAGSIERGLQGILGPKVRRGGIADNIRIQIGIDRDAGAE